MSQQADFVVIRSVLSTWLAATRAMDVDAIIGCYAPNAVSYDCHSAFQFRGRDALRRHLTACFDHMRGPVTADIHDLSISAGTDLAMCHFTMHCGCTGQDGNEHWSWLRMTICLRCIGDRWMIVHDHCSAPFDPMTGKAMLDAASDTPKDATAA